MKHIIPGHVRAFTWILALVTSITMYACTKEWNPAIGIIIVIVGAFLGDQATHLAQEDHSDTPPTWIEKQQQKHRIPFVILGLLVSILGVILITT